MRYPIYHEIAYANLNLYVDKFSQQSGFVFLDSATVNHPLGRYSFIAFDPFLIMQSKNGYVQLGEKSTQANPWQVLKKLLNQYPLQMHPDLPPFQGGAAGYFAYDLYQHLENIHSAQTDDMQFPDLALGFYDLVIAFDHVVQRAWIFSSGLPEIDEIKRITRAQERLQWLLSDVSCSPRKTKGKTYPIKSNFTEQEYKTAVQKVKDYILAGDIFEANIAQRFKACLSDEISSYDLYQQLRKKNPAPFAAYIHFDNATLASASPERFLKLTNGYVEARPIKGTRARGKSEYEDQQFADELVNSTKDRAENVMIVDLLRNDLSRVCKPHTVKVPQLCGLESYATVHHLVSVVTGELKPNIDAIDLLCAAFPGGSITGAPKIRAMEIIAELEPNQRGPYCGSIGYIGFDGNMDTSIVIRTYAIKNNIVTFQAGGAVTLDSDPQAEYDETLIKARALCETLNDFNH